MSNNKFGKFVEDFGGTQLGEMGRVTSDLAITEQHGVHLSSTGSIFGRNSSTR